MRIYKSYFIKIFLVLGLSSCSLSPGMHLDSKKTWLTMEESVYVEALNKEIFIQNINNFPEIEESEYRLGIGDQISYTVWGVPEIFPTVYTSPDQNLRRVDSNGDIFFPFVGSVSAAGKTNAELRTNLTNQLSNFFSEPQLDITIARFNSQFIFLLGEVTQPKKIYLTDISLSLSDALGEVNGVNPQTGDGGEIYIIRNNSKEPEIFRADISSPAGFLAASNFQLQNKDIIYVNAKGTTRWNRVVSQFFPFSSFLNSVDNLTKD